MIVKLVHFLRTAIMMLLVGSSIMFSSALVQKSANTFEQNPNSQITDKLQVREVVAWIFILSALGVATYILIMSFAQLSKFNIDDFTDDILSRTNHWAMV